MAPSARSHHNTPARSRRVYGQNLLTAPDAVRRLVDAAALDPGDVVVEVGAGRGHLTAALAQRCRRVIAYEVDPALAAAVPAHAGVTVRVADFLAAAPPAEPFTVVGNIPYALTSAVVDWCLHAPGLTAATLLTQLEYARKRTGDYGRWSRLTIATWPWWQWRLAGRVPRQAFRPVPRVDGGILRLTRRPVPLAPGRGYEAFVDLGFSGVGGSLHASLCRRFDPRRVTAAFRAMRLAPDTPVGLVWPEQWLTLFRLLHARAR
ncbi:ErmE/ErmH/ErmO/ErmR family 23S rRNA (adenine(2058)-N(6))-methyltransferase [Dactylosporangium sp. NPDC049525]|uniref:ErmE/ErmH/ErmO/ErmR family 23S rRNA (adenine(2058)-N(6))-methyltransferase n=1 Tax=Dactylosporangium sp. NPDC049525 TaxID=3154730 RepID=UPI00342CE1E7